MTGPLSLKRQKSSFVFLVIIESTFSKLRSSLDGQLEGELNFFTRDRESDSNQHEGPSTSTRSDVDEVELEQEPVQLRLDLANFHRIDTFI